MTEEDKERLLVDLQKKVASLERRLQGNLSQDEHLQEFLQEVKITESNYYVMFLKLVKHDDCVLFVFQSLYMKTLYRFVRRKMEASIYIYFSDVVSFAEVQPGTKSGRDQSRTADCSDKPCRYSQLFRGTGKKFQLNPDLRIQFQPQLFIYYDGAISNKTL